MIQWARDLLIIEETYKSAKGKTNEDQSLIFDKMK